MNQPKFKNLLITFLLLFTYSTLSFAGLETFIIDPSHSYVSWHIKHLGFSTQTGKWYASGTLMLDKDKPANSSVNVTINVADMVTGIPDLDTHLKGEEFFNVEKYPTATFVSNKVVTQGKTMAKVYGTLTLHGVAKPVVLNVNMNQAAPNPITHKMTVGFSATTELKRSDFGIKAYLPALGDQVKLDIEVEASPK